MHLLLNQTSSTAWNIKTSASERQNKTNAWRSRVRESRRSFAGCAVELEHLDVLSAAGDAGSRPTCALVSPSLPWPSQPLSHNVHSHPAVNQASSSSSSSSSSWRGAIGLSQYRCWKFSVGVLSRHCHLAIGQCTIRQRVFDCKYFSCKICFNVLNYVFFRYWYSVHPCLVIELLTSPMHAVKTFDVAYGAESMPIHRCRQR